MKATFKISGLRQLDAALGQLPKATARSVLTRTGKKALQPMAETARALAPDDPDTGGNDLKASIIVGTKLNTRQAKMARKDARENGKAFATVYMGPTVSHGLHQEYGTVNHGPQAFMRPAFSREAEGAIKIVASELGAEIEKAAKRLAKRAAKKVSNT
jgi:HK97 gp10 family phage protein